MAYKEIDTENLIQVDSVSSYISEIKKMRTSADGISTGLYFRGQETEFWDIEPSIFRNDMLSIEHQLMQIPLQKIPVEFREFKTMFDIMTKYQHYGMCTRLLDLTTNPLVALYFACKLHGEEEYDTEDGKVLKEPYGVIYYTDKYYPSQSTDREVQIISALASYDLTKENTLSAILDKLKYDQIIDNDLKARWSSEEYVKEFINIIQNNYMVMPTYTNERLRKQSGVFLLASQFSFDIDADIQKSVISKSKGKLKDEFSALHFYIDGENKEEILKELDLYNINEATLFPELEHQLNYIKYSNSEYVKTVGDFTKYEENHLSDNKEVYANEEELNSYIIKHIQDILNSAVDDSDINDITKILESNFSVDWYKREVIISKMRRSIAGYYFSKTNDKNMSKEKSIKIIELLNDAVNQFTLSNRESGE